MSNRILQVQVRDHSLDPAQAEVWISVHADCVTPTTEVRGRLTGPRCVHAATVEVAYPFRPLLRRPEAAADLTVPQVIPEPSLWEPACPFVYHGVVELWEDGRRYDQAQLRHGLRRVVLGPAGLRVNGRPLLLRGRAAMTDNEDPSCALRSGGCNLLMTPVTEDATVQWDRADMPGGFCAGGGGGPAGNTIWSGQPLCWTMRAVSGWILQTPSVSWDAGAIRRLAGSGRAKVGVELGDIPREPLPAGVDFIACPSDRAVELHPLGLPLLVYRGGPPSPGVFGTVE